RMNRISSLAPRDSERVPEFAVGQGGEEILDGLQRGAVFEAIPGEERLGFVKDQHETSIHESRVGTNEQAHDHNYATNPLCVGALVEKTRNHRLYRTKSCKSRRELGEGQKTATMTTATERTCAQRNRLPNHRRALTGCVHPLIIKGDQAPSRGDPPHRQGTGSGRSRRCGREGVTMSVAVQMELTRIIINEN